MISTIVVTLGNLAESLIDTSEKIIGESSAITPFCIDWDNDIDVVKARLGERIGQVDQGDGVILLTDIFGGTSTNIALSYQKANKVEVVTGVNLPMIIKTLTLPNTMSVKEAALQIREQGRKAIYIASERL